MTTAIAKPSEPSRTSVRVLDPARLEFLRAREAQWGSSHDCDEGALGRKSAGQPNGAVSLQGPNLENMLCALDAGQEIEESSLCGSDVDGGETGIGGVPQDGF